MPYRPFDLSGRVALITGGNSGIGLGMAKALAEAGADIAIWGSNAAKNAAALESLKPLGVRLHALACDIGDEAAVDNAFAQTVAELGRVDACFANAGTYGHASRFTALETAEWQRVMRINLDGAFYTLRAAARQQGQRTPVRASREGGRDPSASPALAPEILGAPEARPQRRDRLEAFFVEIADECVERDRAADQIALDHVAAHHAE